MDILYYAALTMAVFGVLVVVGVLGVLMSPFFLRDLIDGGRARLDEQLRRGMSSPQVGKMARVREAIDASHLWVELDGRVWPAKLPPFTPTPMAGEAVRVINVVSQVLIVRPEVAGASSGPE